MASAPKSDVSVAPPEVFKSASLDGSDEIPEIFGRYRILKELGGGGMGTVYLALDTQLDREVALKVPHANTKSDAEFLERFDREAKTAAKLSHANICQVYDVGEIDGRRFLTMEYINGRPLSKLVGHKGLTDTLAIQMVRLVALAVGAAHKQGIIHRDLKPANIMLTQDGKPKVTDFGLARRLGTSDQRLTQSGMIVGTPAYMPLEQLQGELDQVGPHSDVYSLGVILYELLTGHLPFDVPSDAPVMSLFAKILTSPPDPPTKHRPELDPRLESIVLKAVAKQHADRYQTMTEFAAALSEFLKFSHASVQEHSVRAGQDTVSVILPPHLQKQEDRPTTASAADRSTSSRQCSMPQSQTEVVAVDRPPSRWSRATSPRTILGVFAALAILVGAPLWFRDTSTPVEDGSVADRVDDSFLAMMDEPTDSPPANSANPPAAAATLQLQSGRWVPVVDETTPLPNPKIWSYEGGVLKGGNREKLKQGESSKIWFSPLEFGDFIFRSRVRSKGSITGGCFVTFRDNSAGRYDAWFNDRFGLGLKQDGRKYKIVDKEITDKKYLSKEVDWAVAAIGDQVSIYANGKRVLKTQPAKHLRGTFAIFVKHTGGVFNHPEMMLLDGVPSPTSSWVEQTIRDRMNEWLNGTAEKASKP